MNAHSSSDDDLDTAAMNVPTIVKLAAGACTLTGMFTVGLGIQTSLMFRMVGFVPAVIAAMVGLGVATSVVGFMGLRGKLGATIAGLGGSGVIAVAGAVWALTSFRSGVISPLSIWIVIFSVLSTVVSSLAWGPAKRVSAARASLRARGLDFGV